LSIPQGLPCGCSFCQVSLLYNFKQILGQMAHNVPAVWNVFSSKKAENLFSISDVPNIHPSKRACQAFFSNFSKKILSTECTQILNLDGFPAYVPCLALKNPKEFSGITRY
jgi:hypothetical protein